MGDTAIGVSKWLRPLAVPPFGLTVLAGAALGLIALSAVAVVLHAELREREGIQRQATASQETLRGVQEVLSLVRRVEYGHQGYVLTGDEAYRETFQEAARQLPEQLRGLQNVGFPDAEQRRLAAMLEQRVESMLANSAHVNSGQTQRAAAAMTLAGARQSMAIMNEIRRLGAEISEGELSQAEASLAEGQERSMRRFGYLTALLATIAAIVTLAAVLIARIWNRVAAAESALHVALAQLRAVFDGTMDGLLTISRSGTIETINSSARSMLKSSANKEERLHVRKFIAPRSTAKGGGSASLRDLLSKVGEVSEVWLRRTDRTLFPADVALNEISIGGRRIFVAAIRDVTERHRIHRLAALRRSFLERLAEDRVLLRVLSTDPSRIDELLAWVHRLGGSAGTFGAPRISEAAVPLEELLRCGNGALHGAAMAVFLAEVDRELDQN